LLSAAPIAPTANQTSPPPPATPEGSTEGDVQVVEEEVTEDVGTPERFPVCTAVLEAEMIPCEVPDNYGS
jgi:hypothetical protein